MPERKRSGIFRFVEKTGRKFHIQRDNSFCLNCNATRRTESIPGLTVRSVPTDGNGNLLLTLGGILTNPSAPIGKRCSYMIHSRAFAALPVPARTAVLRKIKTRLTSGDDCGWINETERKRILDMLRETVAEFPLATTRTDRTVADKIRIRILEAMEALSR